MAFDMELEQTQDDFDNSVDNTDASQSSSETPAPEARESEKQQQEATPFHEHPRFKELVEQKNAALQAQKALEQRLADFEGRFSQANQAPKAPSKDQSEFESLISDLKNIDPRLAAQLEAHSKAASRIDELQSKLEAFEKSSNEQLQQATVKEALSRINQLHDSNKVSPEMKGLINDKLDLLYMQGKLNLQNLDTEYKGILEAQNKFIDMIKRAERESYVKAKKQDSTVPASQPKGQPAKAQPKKFNYSTDKEQARQQIVSNFLKKQAANRDADAV